MVQQKLPLGAIVSPLSPFFNERAKHSAVEKVKVDLMDEETLGKLNYSSIQANRFRSCSQSSASKESEGGFSSCSTDSSDSNQSFATPINKLEDEQLPKELPRISHENWSKFGITLFTPKLVNPNSQVYYHYPALERNKSSIPSRLIGNRPRSKSTVTPSVSGSKLPPCSTLRHSTVVSNPSSPLAYNILERNNSLRFPMDRNHTSYN